MALISVERSEDAHGTATAILASMNLLPIRVAVVTSLLAAVVGSVACSSTPYDASSFTETCGTPADLAGKTPYDSLELRLRQIPIPGSFGDVDAGTAAPGADPSFTVLDTRGTLCASASDSVACKKKAAAATAGGSDWASTNETRGGGYRQLATTYTVLYFVVTRGDDVRVLASRAELADYFGPLDSPEKALVAYSPSAKTCLAARTDSDGISILREEHNSCGDVDRQTLIRVGPKGQVSEVSEAISTGSCNVPPPS
jgi:hypothetical protein